MKYIGKISSVLLTVAFVVAIIFANNNKSEIRGSKSSTDLRFQEKNQASFVKKKREPVIVVHDKEQLFEEEIVQPTETEIHPQPGEKEIFPINDVVHSATLHSVKKANKVYTKTTLLEAPGKELTKQEIQNLIKKHNTSPQSISNEELVLIKGYLEEEVFINDANQHDASADRGANYSAPSVVINELMYNPAMPNNADGSSDNTDGREWLELYNTTGSAIDLTGWTMSEGFSYTFPAASIAAGGYLVLAKDSVSYYAKHGSYPDLDWGGDGNGALANGGEEVEISDANGVVIDSVDFDDGWASSTDGDGPSLERVHPNLNGDLSSSWAAYTGTDSAGTPGARNSAYRALLVQGFEGSVFPPLGWQAISNNTSNSVSQSGAYPHSGSYSARMSSYNSASDYTQYLITPKLSVVSGDSLAFWFKKSSSSTYNTDSIAVGISATDSGAASFTFGPKLSWTSTSYQRHAQALESYAGQEVFVAIKYTGTYDYYYYIDDVTGPEVWVNPNPVPVFSSSSLAFGDVFASSTKSETLTLTNNGGGPLTYTVSSDNAVYTVTGASASLAPDSTDVLTVVFAPLTDSSYPANLVFTHNGNSSPDTVSLSGAGTHSILAESFEGWTSSYPYSTVGAPDGWSQLQITAGGSYGPWYAYSYRSYSGSKSARAPYNSSGHEHVLISPALDISSNTNAPLGYQLEFMSFGSSYSGTDIYVQIDSAAAGGGAPDFAGADTLVSLIGGTNLLYAWSANEARLSAYSGTYYIGFRAVDDDGYSAYIDDIEVLPVPPQPTLDLAANSFKMVPIIVGDSVTTQLTIGSNIGGGALEVSSVSSSNSAFVVALTTMATGNSVVSGGDVDLDVTWDPDVMGLKKTTVVVTHNAASSPDTITITGEAGRQHVDFNDRDFPYGWRNLDLDPPGANETEYYGYGEGEGWSHYYSYGPGYGGYYAQSHFSADGSNDWMISEKVMPVAGDSMIFYSNSSSSSILEDTLFVYVSTSNEVGLDTSGNTVGALLNNGTLLDTVVSQGYTNIRSAYSLANWVDDTVFLAIQHKGSAGTNEYSYRKVDDILLPQNWVSPNPVVAGLPGKVSFDAVYPGQSSTATGSLYNAGGSNLVISSVAVDNALFTVTPTSGTLLPDSSATITGTYSPTVSGDDTAHVVITSNAASSPDTVMFVGSAFQTSGGPDMAGNTWVNNHDPNGTPFAWIDTSGAEDSGVLVGDDSYGVIELPFEWRFYGLPYNEITVNSNGLIGMGDVYLYYYSNYTIPYASAPNNYIAPMWDDWTLSTSSTGIPGAILTKTVGSEPSRKFVVTFQDMVKYGSNTDYYTWQVIFEEASGNVVVQYLDLDGSTSSADYGGGATVGIENANGTDGLLVSYNGSYTFEDSSTITFVAGPIPATGIEGVVWDTDEVGVGGVEVWMNGSMLVETGHNTVFDNEGFEDTSFVGAWNNNASEPWWVFPPELLTTPNFWHSSEGDLIWNDSLGALGTNVFTPMEGDRALKMWGQFTAGDSNYTSIYKQVDLSGADHEGMDVYASAWVMTAEDNKISGGNGFFVALNWFTINFDWIRQDQSEWLTAEDEADEWHYLDVHGEAPAGAAYLQCQLTFYQDAVNSSGSVYVDETSSSLTPGSYSFYGLPAGEYSVEFSKEGFNSSYYSATLELNDTLELIAMITPEALVDYYSGFEEEDGDDLGGSHADDPSGALFEVLDSLHLVLVDSAGVDTAGATVWDTTEIEVDPYMGDGMLVYPGSGRDTYEDDAVAMWVAGETFDASTYMEGGGYLNMSWRANFATEEDFDYFYVGLMLEDSSVIWDEDNGALSGASTGWDYFANDVSWVNELVGAETVTPVVMFSSDGGTVDGWGGAFDDLRVDGNPYFLAGPGDLQAESFGSTVPVHWEGPASSGRATYNLRRFNIRDMDNLRMPSTSVNGTHFVLSKGQREFESLQIAVDFDNTALPRDVASYTLHRREWSDGMIGEWEEYVDGLVETHYEDTGVEEGNYYDYRVSLMYDEGPADWESNESQAHVGIPNVVLMDSMQMEDFYPDLGGWTVHSTDSTVYWTTGDSAFYDSLNNPLYYQPTDFDSSFAFVVGAGKNGAGTVVLISPFMDWSWHTSGVVSVDAWHHTPSSWYDYYGSAKLMVRSQMEEWKEAVDVSYTHSNGVFDAERVDVGPMVGGRDRVQLAIVYDYPNYSSGNYSGLAIDNLELHVIDGPGNLSYTNDTESVTLHWESSDGRRANEYPVMMSQEEKDSQIRLLQNGVGKNISGAQVLGRSLDGAGDIRNNNNRELGDDMSDPYLFTLHNDTLITGSTEGFNHDYEVYVSGDYGNCPYASTSPDVVFLMTVPDSVNGIIIDLCDSWYDTKVFVYSADDILAGDTTNIACNDDYCSSDSSSYTSYLELGSMMAEDGGVSAGDYYIVVGGYGTGSYESSGTYWMEISTMIPPPDMTYNVWKDGNLTEAELPDTVFSYTDYNVSLLESEYTVNSSVLMNLSREGESGLDPGYVHSEHSNAVFAAKENMLPGSFNLITPADGASLVITEDNIGGNQIFAWSQSVDPNGSEINYHILWETETDTGMFQIWDDTTGTAFLVPVENIAGIMTALAQATGEYIADFSWSVWADDGYDQVEAGNGPRTITVDVGWYLGIDDVAAIPGVFALHQNYPNPFNPVTTIRYDVPEQSHVTMDIYNLLGQRVATLVNGVQEPGYHAVLWNGTNMNGAAMSSGMYFYHIKAGDFRAVKKLILVK